MRWRQRLLCTFEGVRKASWRSLLEREKWVREIEKDNQETLQDGYPKNWGPTALPELCRNPSPDLEERGEDEENWVQSLTLFFLFKPYSHFEGINPILCMRIWFREVKELTWGPLRSGRARIWTHIHLTSEPILFLVFNMAQRSHCRFKLLQKGWMWSHLLIPQIFSSHTNHLFCLFHHPAPLLQLPTSTVIWCELNEFIHLSVHPSIYPSIRC